jgi:hypothetical protein
VEHLLELELLQVELEYKQVFLELLLIMLVVAVVLVSKTDLAAVLVETVAVVLVL